MRSLLGLPPNGIVTQNDIFNATRLAEEQLTQERRAARAAEAVAAEAAAAAAAVEASVRLKREAEKVEAKTTPVRFLSCFLSPILRNLAVSRCLA